MNSGLFSLFFAIGVAAWVYNKTTQRTGNTKTSLTTAGVVGLIAFFVFFTILHFFLNVH